MSACACPSWVSRFRFEGERGLSIAPRRRGMSPIAPPDSVCRRSSRCGGYVSPQPRSPRRSLCRSQPCPRSSHASGWVSSVWLGLSSLSAMSIRARELVHVDVKKLGRIQAAPAIASPAHQSTTADCTDRHQRRVGFEYVHIAIDDYSRSPTPRCCPRKRSAPASCDAPSFYRRYDHRSESYRQRPAYIAPRTRSPSPLGIKHNHTRPYRPQTNGKAERFIRTLLAGWPTARSPLSHDHTTALDGWLFHYNHRRRHSALGHQPPASRTNLLGPTPSSAARRCRA